MTAMLRSMYWTDVVTTLAAAASAIFTGALVLMAYFAWTAAKDTLEASRESSEAATRSANAAIESAKAAEAANEQAKLDGIEQTRPYVYVEIVPGLAGAQSYDVRVKNVGRSAARDLVLVYDAWDEEPDDVTQSLQRFFSTSRTLPPTCQIRSMWRLEGNFTDGTRFAGASRRGTITATYTSDDPARPSYTDKFDVLVDYSGMWPVGEDGPDPKASFSNHERAFYVLGQALVRRVSELGR